MIHVGSNTIGMWLGKGWYSQSTINVGPPVIKMIVRLVYTNGTVDYIGTKCFFFF